MSWIKKIIGKKDATGADNSSGQSASTADETVLFGDNQPGDFPSQPSRSSMISELAGLDPEASADLSSDLLSTPDEPEDEVSEESISLDFDEPSDQQETAFYTDNALPNEDTDSGQRSTAIFSADELSAPLLNAVPRHDVDSDQQKTAVFESDPIIDPAPLATAQSSSGSKSATSEAATAAPSSMPNLEFDSDPQLDNDFNDPSDLGKLPAVESSQPSADTESQPDQSGVAAATRNTTLDPVEGFSMIDQMAGGFDLDLGEADEPTSEALSLMDAARSAREEDDAENMQNTGEQPTAPPAEKVADLSATANGDNYFDQLATAKLEQPADAPPPSTPTPPVVTPAAVDHADEFDATVITTAASEPSVAAGADYVTGWIVVVDGPGKGQSRPIRSGINAVGRAPDQAVPLYFGAKSDGEISRRDHTRIVYDARGNHFKLIHGASRNLTYLNDEPVHEITDLKPYDRIVIGKTTLLFLPLCGNIFRW